MTVPVLAGWLQSAPKAEKPQAKETEKKNTTMTAKIVGHSSNNGTDRNQSLSWVRVQGSGFGPGPRIQNLAPWGPRCQTTLLGAQFGGG